MLELSQRSNSIILFVGRFERRRAHRNSQGTRKNSRSKLTESLKRAQDYKLYATGSLVDTTREVDATIGRPTTVGMKTMFVSVEDEAVSANSNGVKRKTTSELGAEPSVETSFSDFCMRGFIWLMFVR